MTKKKRKVIINFGNGRFTIPDECAGRKDKHDNMRDKIEFANDMIYEKVKSGNKRKR